MKFRRIEVGMSQTQLAKAAGVTRQTIGLIEAGEFSDLRGLIYFTDGYGTFPAYKPDYQTAFVFLDDEYRDPEMPPWAIKLVLQDDEI